MPNNSLTIAGPGRATRTQLHASVTPSTTRRCAPPPPSSVRASLLTLCYGANAPIPIFIFSGDSLSKINGYLHDKVTVKGSKVMKTAVWATDGHPRSPVV